MTAEIRIRELDGDAIETAELLLPILRAAVRHDLVDHPAPILEYARIRLATPGNHVAAVMAAFDGDGEPAVAIRIGHDTNSNRTLAYGNLFFSDPARRGKGFLTALIPALQRWARANACDRLVLDMPAESADTAAAEALGGRVVGVEKRSSLDLTAVDRAQLEAWAIPSAANAEYRSVRWSGAVPEDIVASYVRARNAMDDAPHGDLELEIKELTIDDHRAREKAQLARGLLTHVVAALAPDGSVAGYTQLYTYAGTTLPLAHTGDTAVTAAHRGRGLGLRLKAENTVRVLENLPYMRVIDTWNNEDNAPMLRINELMGYRLADVWRGVQFDL